MYLNGLKNKDIKKIIQKIKIMNIIKKKKKNFIHEKDKINNIIEEDDNNLNNQDKYSKDNNIDIYYNKIKKENKNARQSKEQNYNN